MAIRKVALGPSACETTLLTELTQICTNLFLVPERVARDRNFRWKGWCIDLVFDQLIFLAVRSGMILCTTPVTFGRSTAFICSVRFV